MFSSVIAGTVYGIRGHLICVETDVSKGLPCISMVGYLGSEVREAGERVRVALRNGGITIPPMHITINLSPANMRKEGTAYDLPIAVGVMISMGLISQSVVNHTLIVGELGLNGEVKAVPGILPIVMEAKRQGCKACIVPADNAGEAAVVEGIATYGVSRLSQVKDFLLTSAQQEKTLEPIRINPEEVLKKARENSMEEEGFADIIGQENVKRAAIAATAGFHHLLLIGPPGAGKTMIAKRISSILPPLSMEESLEISSIYSVAGKCSGSQGLVCQRPFLNPHHTITERALVGGGRIPKPGMISLAHGGVLFLDELPEFRRSTIEILRQPIEDKQVHIARAYGNYSYPADFMLVAAMNPCPCGYFPDMEKCVCSENDIKRYLNKVSGPILDRIDICVEAPRVKTENLIRKRQAKDAEGLVEQVERARDMQKERYQNTKYRFNSEIPSARVAEYCFLGEEEKAFMKNVSRKMELSVRAYHKVLRVARTLADLNGSKEIQVIHLAEAVSYRMDGGIFWKKRRTL